MNILITGGCGFVGFNLSLFLKEKGYYVISMDNLARNGAEISKGLLEKQGIDFVHGDARNPEDFNKIGKKFDIVLNIAADPSTIEGYQNPPFSFTNNFLSVINILEIVRKNKAKMIHWSTNKVYCGNRINAIKRKELKTRYVFDDNDFKSGIDESFSVDGNDHSIYGLTKLAGDLYCQEYASAFNLNIIIDRFSCLAGEWQWGLPKQGWFSWWPIAFVYKLPLTYIGWGGKQLRDILYIKDMCDLILKQIESVGRFKGDVFNVGGGSKNTISPMESTAYLERKLGHKHLVNIEKTPRRADQCVYVSNINKVKKAFNWEPKFTPEKAMDNIVDWIHENRSILDKVYKRNKAF